MRLALPKYLTLPAEVWAGKLRFNPRLLLSHAVRLFGLLTGVPKHAYL